MIFDAHGDIMTDIEMKSRLGKDIFKEYHLPLYNQADVIGSIFVNFTDPFSPSQKYTFDNINQVAVEYLKNSSAINVVGHATDFKLGKLNVIMGIEGAKALPNLKAVEEMYDLGYRHIGLTWNERNQFACGIEGIGGVSQLGEDVIKWCNKHGMIVDFAHLNFQSFLDAAAVSSKPILFSHGNAAGLCEHPRNLNDLQLNLIKETDGVIGICAIKSFLTTDSVATIDDFVNHIRYVKDRIGVRHVGLGMDYCHYLDDMPANDVVGLEDMGKTVTLRNKLREVGFTASEIEDVMFKNMLRVVKAHLEGEPDEV